MVDPTGSVSITDRMVFFFFKTVLFFPELLNPEPRKDNEPEHVIEPAVERVAPATPPLPVTLGSHSRSHGRRQRRGSLSLNRKDARLTDAACICRFEAAFKHQRSLSGRPHQGRA